MSSERQKVAEALEEMTFSDGTVIVKQGEPGVTFYIIKKGSVIIMKKNDSGKEEQVNLLKEGEFFGERALVNSEPRAATVIAKGAVECLTLNQAAFDLLLGPLKEILQRVPWESKSNANLLEMKKEVKKSVQEVIRKEDLDHVGVLGRGSFGLVRFVRHKVTKKTYALKQICKSQVVQLGQQEHVISEKNAMAGMDHPFIIKLFATYKDKDFLYFLLEVCLGGELFTLLRQMRNFNESTAKFYAASVVLAFEYMHERDIIYRDLKVNFRLLLLYP